MLKAKGGIPMTELEFAERLKRYRKAKNMTQQELADKLGVSNKSVSRWETGSYPDVALLGPLARVLGVTVDDLLGESPPIRSLGRADWQNLLSFAFAVGGGVLFFLLDLFMPSPACYLLYLGAMAYGVYLQRHYTYRSRWFHSANLVMNFFVNARLLSPVLVLLLPDTARSLLSYLAPDSLSSLYGAVSPLRLAGTMCAFLLAPLALTAVTGLVIWMAEGKARFYAERAPFAPVKLLPLLCPVLGSCFFLLYSGAPAPLPLWMYTRQTALFLALLAVLTLLAVICLPAARRPWMLFPALALSAGCCLLPRALSRELVCAVSNRILYTYVEGMNPQRYLSFGQAAPGLFLLAAVLAVLYLLCCLFRIRVRRAP